MTGTIIENVSGGKLSVLVAVLIVGQITCFLVGGLIAPKPEDVSNIIGTVCKDNSTRNETTWLYSYGSGKCKTVVEDRNMTDTDIVYVFQMPGPDGSFKEYSRWQQNLIGVLQIDIKTDFEEDVRSMITLDARLAYRNKGEPEEEWKLYAQSLEKRNLDCKFEEDFHRCSAVPLFELGSMSHNYYLLNIRLPIDASKNSTYKYHVQALKLIVINQNEDFSKVWVSLKTVFFPIFIFVMIWFWKRVKKLKRKLALLEGMLISVGFTLCLLNMPLEFLNLYFNLSLLLLVLEIRQTVFYAKLLSFWLVFAKEHTLNQLDSSLKQYWGHIIVVLMGCLLLFIFDLCERGIQLSNPFYSIWIADLGYNFNLALTFIIISRILIGLYFLLLCYMVWKVFANMYDKRRQFLPTMPYVRRIHYQGIMYRFKIMTTVSVICAALTVIGIILGQAAEWNLDENIKLENTSAFWTGLYGMWNIYVIGLLVLYAPSQKQWVDGVNTAVDLQVSLK